MAIPSEWAGPPVEWVWPPVEWVGLPVSPTLPYLRVSKVCLMRTVIPISPKFIYISIYFGHKTLFSPNLMIIITGTFRNTANYMK